jgi:hypothetical protein
MYLIIREIIPIEDGDGNTLTLHQRVHLVLNEGGEYTFPSRADALAADPEIDEERASEYFGLASYFIFTRISWDTSAISLTHVQFTATEDAIIPESVTTVIPYALDHRVEYMSIFKRHFVKFRSADAETDPIGSTFEFALSQTKPTVTI